MRGTTTKLLNRSAQKKADCLSSRRAMTSGQMFSFNIYRIADLVNPDNYFPDASAHCASNTSGRRQCPGN